MKQNKYLTLALEFFRFGCFTFGGGWSIVSQMQQLYVEKKKTISGDDLLDIVGVARTLPGTMIGNVAVLYGHYAAGIPGALICLFSMILPPLVLLVCISFFYNVFRTNFWVNAAMEGVAAAVMPIVACAALGLVKSSLKNAFGVLIMVVCAAIYLLCDINVVWLILLGISSGLIYGEVISRKEADGNGAA